MPLHKWLPAIIIVCFLFSGNCWSDNGTSTNVKDQLPDDDRQVMTIQASSFKKTEPTGNVLALADRPYDFIRYSNRKN